jgi:UDP-N-acetylmuramoylalanine--D-glutamate ligase
MTPVTVFAGKRVLVFGLGGSGVATAEALRAGGADVLVADDSEKSIATAAEKGFRSAPLAPESFAGLDALVLSPGVPLTHPQPHRAVTLALAAGVEIIGDVELFVRERRAIAPGSPFVGITGTNGKSTTTALTAHLFAACGRAVAMGGNIGVPVLLLPPPAPDRVHVVELSSYQIDLSPTLDASVGIHLNLTEDHLDRHGTMENYANIKERLVSGVLPGGTAVVGVDDAFSAAIAARAAAAGIRTVPISVTRELSSGIFLRGSELICARDGAEEVLADLAGIGSLRGAHNAQNAAAAFAAGLALGLERAEIAAALRTFPGLKHRMEEVRRRGHVLFDNDSKATNADAAARALGSFQDIFWIAGGKPKTGGIASLAEFFPRVRKAYLIGEAADEFSHTLGNAVPHVIAGTMDRAVEIAAADAAAADGEPVVLLSPACASFDQYRNFEVRGDAFRELVLELRD